MTATRHADPFVGAWSLNVASSAFDANHHPRAGTMRIEIDADGSLVMNAEGVDEKGEPCVERPNRLHPDGRDYPVPDCAGPGLVVRTTRPDVSTLRTECRRQDGAVVGRGTFRVSPDGRSLTASTSGWDSQQREFQQTTMWDRL
jgi:hypothetical protein